VWQLMYCCVSVAIRFGMGLVLGLGVEAPGCG